MFLYLVSQLWTESVPPSLFRPAIILQETDSALSLRPCCALESLRVFVKIPGHLSRVSELGNLHFNQQAPTLGESDLVRR